MLHLGHSALAFGRVRIFCSSFPITMIFSLSCVSRLTTLSLRVLVYPHLLHARKTFFSFFCGRRVLPHLGQNCKTLVLSHGRGVAFLTVTLNELESTIRSGSGESECGLAGGRKGTPGVYKRMFYFLPWFSRVSSSGKEGVSRLKWPRPYPVVFSGLVFCLAGRMGDFRLTKRDMGESRILRMWNRKHFPSRRQGDRNSQRQIVIQGLLWAISSAMSPDVLRLSTMVLSVGFARSGPGLVSPVWLGAG